MSRLIRLAPIALIAMLSLTLIGCGDRTADDATTRDDAPPVAIGDLEQDMDHHEHPETYAEAVAELDAMRTQISQAFAANDIEAADGPIHEVGHVLEDVVELAREEAFSDEAVAEINAAVETLFDAFGRVDEKIHGGEGATYDEVQPEIDSAFETLQQHLPANE